MLLMVRKIDDKVIEVISTGGISKPLKLIGETLPIKKRKRDGHTEYYVTIDETIIHNIRNKDKV